MKLNFQKSVIFFCYLWYICLNPQKISQISSLVLVKIFKVEIHTFSGSGQFDSKSCPNPSILCTDSLRCAWHIKFNHSLWKQKEARDYQRTKLSLLHYSIFHLDVLNPFVLIFVSLAVYTRINLYSYNISLK